MYGGLSYLLCLLLDDSAGGAGLDAGAALEASVLIDLIVRVTLMDGAGGAAFRAGAASDAITGDLVCHMYRPSLFQNLTRAL